MDRLKVIVAENDQNAETSLAGILPWNWEIVSASDAANLIALARKEYPDAVILESLFPGGALSVLDQLQSSLQTGHIPVIAVFGNMGPQKDELLSTGARTCMKKPIDPEALCTTIKKCVERRSTRLEAPAGLLRDPARMEALEETGLLDSAPSDQFDNITKLTAKILGVPVALVSLVDKDRQFFKSQYGLPDPWATLRQTPLSHSFCQWVVSEKDSLVVEDARKHPVLCNNLAIENLGAVAYAGQPLTVGEDQIIGSFCAIDNYPRSWTYDELATLRDLARVTEAVIAFEKEIYGSELSGPAAIWGDKDVLIALRTAAKAIEAITRLLGRSDIKLRNYERKTLLGIAEKLSHKQIQLSQGKS